MDIDRKGVQDVLIALGEAPRIKLKNGVRVVNFSSPHPFNFVTGEVLPACSPERARRLMLDVKTVETPNALTKLIDVDIHDEMSDIILEELEALAGEPNIDIILVPFRVLKCLKLLLEKEWDLLGYKNLKLKVRTLRCADRVTKEIYSDRFCW